MTGNIDAISSATYTAKSTNFDSLITDGNGFAISGNGTGGTALRFKTDKSVDVTLQNLTMKNCVITIEYGGGAVGMYKGSLIVKS